jgi:hypothetical protein
MVGVTTLCGLLALANPAEADEGRWLVKRERNQTILVDPNYHGEDTVHHSVDFEYDACYVTTELLDDFTMFLVHDNQKTELGPTQETLREAQWSDFGESISLCFDLPSDVLRYSETEMLNGETVWKNRDNSVFVYGEHGAGTTEMHEIKPGVYAGMGSDFVEEDSTESRVNPDSIPPTDAQLFYSSKGLVARITDDNPSDMRLVTHTHGRSELNLVSGTSDGIAMFLVDHGVNSTSGYLSFRDNSGNVVEYLVEHPATASQPAVLIERNGDPIHGPKDFKVPLQFEYQGHDLKVTASEVAKDVRTYAFETRGSLARLMPAQVDHEAGVIHYDVWMSPMSPGVFVLATEDDIISCAALRPSGTLDSRTCPTYLITKLDEIDIPVRRIYHSGFSDQSNVQSNGQPSN